MRLFDRWRAKDPPAEPGNAGSVDSTHPDVDLLRSDDWNVRAAAARRLGALREPGAVDPLIALIVEAEEAAATASEPAPTAVRTGGIGIVHFGESLPSRARTEALDALMVIADHDGRAVARALQSAMPFRLKLLVADRFARRGDQSVTPWLEQALRTKDPTARQEVFGKLSQIRQVGLPIPAGLQKSIARGRKDPDPVVRHLAEQILAGPSPFK